jgi:hypothetical protein
MAHHLEYVIMTTIIVKGETVDINVTNETLIALVDKMVEDTKTVYGANIRIAAKLNDLMPNAWFDVEHLEVSDDAKTLAPHKTLVLAGFKRAGHSNPSKAYKDIRDYGRNLRAGLAPNGKTMADGSPLPEGEATGEGANPAKRSDMLFAVEEGTRYWKRMAKSDNAELVALADDFAALMKKRLKFDVRLVK